MIQLWKIAYYPLNTRALTISHDWRKEKGEKESKPIYRMVDDTMIRMFALVMK
jgi:hypothetical protein